MILPVMISRKGSGYIDWKYSTGVHLMKKYGSKAVNVLQLSENQPDLKELLVLNHPFIKAEVLYAIQDEMATTVDDVLERRLGLKLRDEEASKAVESYVEGVLQMKLLQLA